MSIAMGAVSRLMTRSSCSLLNIHQSWYDMLTVIPEAKAELEFWLREIIKYNGQDTHLYGQSPLATRVVYTDASHQGYSKVAARVLEMNRQLECCQ